MSERVRKLQGTVKNVEKTGDFKLDDEKTRWEKCIFTIELTGFSNRTPEEVLPKELVGKEVKMARYCCFDWHYKLGVRKTFEPEETEGILSGKQTEHVFW